MNLLKDQWIPVRPLPSGGSEKITLGRLLCSEDMWEICLPRDDMELAALQLIICITQTIITPKNMPELKLRITRPLSEAEFNMAINPYDDWFRVDHPKYPFMQVKGVVASKQTQLDKLLAGLTGATNSCFVNQPGQGEHICGGCAAIALFNQASCTPSFGGGFKASLRGSAPITTLIQGSHLRQAVWLNVLSEDHLPQLFPWFHNTRHQKPSWIEPIKARDNIQAQQIGLIRGLFWQPAYVELLPAGGGATCVCCGFPTEHAYDGFKKAKFNFTVTGTWPHPHSPRIMINKKGDIQEKFAAFTTAAPLWTQLSRFIVRQKTNDENVSAQQPAAVVLQARKLSNSLHLLVGGYRNNQSSIIGRRHEVFNLNPGWDSNTGTIHYLVQQGVGYRDALYKALYVFAKGFQDMKGAGVELYKVAEMQFYRGSEAPIQDALALMDFDDPAPQLARMQAALKEIVQDIFDESVRPYLQNSELIKTRAVAGRTLQKYLRNLELQQDKGGNYGTAST
ncbi:MAG TPA: type I-E CRISPR-associated protein Cse1/CasA [Dissulfurispiraceae bacterium]|nr:type I-E CRISPR-associated protein Cse1/CasA [Dissulfurispiraceae bacterium]